MAVQTDRIEREVLIAAPVERVWTLITSAEHLGRWFGDAGAEIDLRPGGALELRWRDHGTVHGRVEAVEPPHRFAYRWLSRAPPAAEPTPANSTLTEFTLAAEGDGTRCRRRERLRHARPRGGGEGRASGTTPAAGRGAGRAGRVRGGDPRGTMSATVADPEPAVFAALADPTAGGCSGRWRSAARGRRRRSRPSFPSAGRR